MSSTLYNTIKAIYFNLDTNSQGYATLNIPFAVKEIIVKQIGYLDSSATFTQLNSMAILYSNLVQNNALGVVNMSVFQPTQLSTRFSYKNPFHINGNFQFQLRDLTGSTFNLTGVATSRMVVILEFINYDTPVTHVTI